MILKNLFRRKTRTLLTVLGIAIGVAAIVALGALAESLRAGYGTMLAGSKADMVLSQPNTMDVSYSSVSETVGPQLAAMPEVKEISGMLEGLVSADNQPFFIVFGYPNDSFVLTRFRVIAGVGLDDRAAKPARGKPLLLGSAAAEVLKKSPGETIRMGGSTYRVVGIYETGDAFEDSAALLTLEDAQDLLGKPRQVSLYYIKLKEPSLRPRLEARAARQWPQLALTGAQDLESQQTMSDILAGYVWVIGGLAILIGGMGMMNSQLMAVYERTREIGVLRAVGWSRRRVLGLILGESLWVCLAGGLLGVGLGWLAIAAVTRSAVLFGTSKASITPAQLLQALGVVASMGLLAGLYPAWTASRLTPVEALRYEGGSSGGHRRVLPLGGLAVQSLWQRATRTVLTLAAISVTVGAIMALEGVMRGMFDSMTGMMTGANAQIILRQNDISDTSLSSVDERIGDKIAALPEVKGTAGVIIYAVILPPPAGMFLVQGYAPDEFGIQRFHVVEGRNLSGNRQILIGRLMAQNLKKGVGETLDLSGVRFQIVGIYETGISWEESGGVVSLRDAQTFAGRPRKVSILAVQLRDPAQAPALVEQINRQFPEVYATLAGDFANQMPDFKSSSAMMGGISLIAILVGGVGVLNTMLMSVFERTREIGVLRALGWRARRILGLILQEALILGLLGGLLGLLLAFGLIQATQSIPIYGAWIRPIWEWDILARALGVALSLGALGGLYPAFRATRLQPVEALRYE